MLKCPLDFMFMQLTRAGACLALAFGREAGGRAAEQVWVEEPGSVVMRRGDRVGRVRGDRVVRGWRLRRAHGQAAPERAASLHLHTVTHLVLDRLLFVHPRDRGGGGRRRSRVWRHVFRRRGREVVERVRARVACRR